MIVEENGKRYKELYHELLLLCGMVGQEKKEEAIQEELDLIWYTLPEEDKRELEAWIASGAKGGQGNLGLKDCEVPRGSSKHPRKEKT